MRKIFKIFIALALVISVLCISGISTFAYQIRLELGTNENIALDVER